MLCFILLPWYPHTCIPLHFYFLTLNSAPPTNVYFSYRYSCSNTGPICFVVLSRSTAVCLLTIRSLCFMSNLCSSENFYSSIPKKFILSISKDVLTLKPNCKDGAA